MLTREEAIASIIAADPAQNFPVMASSDVELLINQIYDEHEVQMKEANRIKEDFRKVALDLDAEASELREQIKAKDEEIERLQKDFFVINSTLVSQKRKSRSIVAMLFWEARKTLTEYRNTKHCDALYNYYYGQKQQFIEAYAILKDNA